MDLTAAQHSFATAVGDEADHLVLCNQELQVQRKKDRVLISLKSVQWSLLGLGRRGTKRSLFARPANQEARFACTCK
jgi:hypothetical protein